MTKARLFLLETIKVKIVPSFKDTYHTTTRGNKRGQTRSESSYDVYINDKKTKSFPTKKAANLFAIFVKSGGKISAYQLYILDPSKYIKIHGPLL